MFSWEQAANGVNPPPIVTLVPTEGYLWPNVEQIETLECKLATWMIENQVICCTNQHARRSCLARPGIIPGYAVSAGGRTIRGNFLVSRRWKAAEDFSCCSSFLNIAGVARGYYTDLNVVRTCLSCCSFLCRHRVRFSKGIKSIV